MNDFIVSAIKYRPSTFHSVVGQPSITKTLKNAISNNHLGHAYLFCGPRGVGKTTCARIFAKALNCSNLNSDTEPCNQCESCISFNENRSYNIHELDAASNNKVDDIRLLIDKVRIPPQLGTYSVYIIDEVHMLSAQAFNAFLKTLEEPPKYAIFILATTEKYKIIPTILSRCQIFDFNRIVVDDIVKHLHYVASQENIKVEPEALNVIALKADGALRDALSIFDQIVSFSENDITYSKTIENLNILDYDYYFKIIDAVLANRAEDVLLLFNTILEKGFEAQYFISGIGMHIRDLLVSATPKTLKLLEVSNSVKDKYKEQVKHCTSEYLFKALEIISNCEMEYRFSRNKRLLVELTLLKLCNIVTTKNTKKSSEKAEILKIKPQEKTSIEPKLVDDKKTVSATLKTSVKKENIKKTEDVKQKNKEGKEDIIGRRRSKTPSISISERLSEISKTSKKEQKTNTENIDKNDNLPNEEEIGVDDFTIEQVESALNKFTEQQKMNKRIKSAFVTYKPEIINGREIAMKVGNALETNIVTKYQAKLINYLCKELNNRNINIKLIEPKEMDRSIQSMGDNEKLEYLIKKNKSVLTLKQKLGLQFE